MRILCPPLRILPTATMVLLLFLAAGSSAAPHEGDPFELRQPDGSLVPVIVWGDEFHQDVECPEGFTLIRDQESGWICYARLSDDGEEYVSTGTIYRGAMAPPRYFLSPEMAQKVVAVPKSTTMRGGE